jgi:hypothetical protein
MKRTTKILASTTGLLAAAAFSGMVTGAAQPVRASSATTVSHLASVDGKTLGVKAVGLQAAPNPSHDCKGKNDCKGTGGCNTGDQGCKGKNSCKGNGGCKTNAAPATQPS